MSFPVEQASFPAALADVDAARADRAVRLVTPAPAGARDAIAAAQFDEMQAFYRSHGGLATLPEVLLLQRQRPGIDDLSTLARWIVQREVLCMEWQQQSWFPLFQFEPRQLRPKAGLREVFAELGAVYDHWELAYWFASINPWLDGRTPVEAFQQESGALLHAARADRFVASGY